MTNKKMEQRLAAAVEKTAPNDVDGVLSRCEERKGTVIPMTTKKTTKRKWTSLIAACLAVMLLGGGGLFYQRANAVASVVSLDWPACRSTRTRRPSLRIWATARISRVRSSMWQ